MNERENTIIFTSGQHQVRCAWISFHGLSSRFPKSSWQGRPNETPPGIEESIRKHSDNGRLPTRSQLKTDLELRAANTLASERALDEFDSVIRRLSIVRRRPPAALMRRD
jgi:hypothetical protein